MIRWSKTESWPSLISSAMVMVFGHVGKRTHTREQKHNGE